MSSTLYGINANNYNDIYVGTPIPAYIFENDTLVDSFSQYPIVYKTDSNFEILGFARIIEYSGGEKVVDYGVDCAPLLQTYNGLSPTNVALIYNETDTIVLSKDPTKYDNTFEISSTTISPVTFDEYDLETAQIQINTKISVPVSFYALSAVEHNSLSIENIGQDGKPICWAACMASIVNYHTGTNYTAVNIAHRAYELGYLEYNNGNYGGLSHGVIRIMYSHYLIDTARTASAITYNILKTNINNDSLIHLRGSRTASDGSTKYHVSVAYGYYYAGSGSKYMYYMEPNGDGESGTGYYRSTAFPSAGSIQFSSPSYTYTNDSYIVCSY